MPGEHDFCLFTDVSRINSAYALSLDVQVHHSDWIVVLWFNELHPCVTRQVCIPCSGLDKATAKRVLEAWEASGASSPDELRKLLVKRSVQSAGAVLIQTLLDAGAHWLS